MLFLASDGNIINLVLHYSVKCLIHRSLFLLLFIVE